MGCNALRLNTYQQDQGTTKYPTSHDEESSFENNHEQTLFLPRHLGGPQQLFAKSDDDIEEVYPPRVGGAGGLTGSGIEIR